jgi:hypothetical protein
MRYVIAVVFILTYQAYLLTPKKFQGGAFDTWGGSGFAGCASLLGPEFERVVYKNNVASGAKIINLYMVPIFLAPGLCRVCT